MKISKLLSIGFSLVILLAILVGIIGIKGMRELRNAEIEMYETQVVGLEYIGKATAAFKQIRLECHKVIIHSFYDDLKGALDAKGRFEASVAEFDYWINKSYEIASTDELLKFHDRMKELFFDTYLPMSENLIDVSISDIPDHNNKLYINVKLASITDVTDGIESLTIGLMDLNSAIAKQTSKNDIRLTQLFISAQYWLLIGAVIAAVIITIYIIRSIAIPINESAEALNEISNGNFNARVNGNYKGVFNVIKVSVNQAAEKLSSYLNEKLDAEHTAHLAEISKVRTEAASEALFSSLNYASKIQRNMLPNDDKFKEAFADYSIIWEPRDIVGGDIYWLKKFSEGTVLCVCDCTGHGIPGALLTMLVVSILESSVNEGNHKYPAEIMWLLEQSLVNVFQVNTSLQSTTSDIKEGCDLAVVYISNNGDIKLSSSNTHVFICDGNEVRQIRGQRIFIGEGRLKGSEDINTVTIPANPHNKFYIASDGLYDQIGGEVAIPFGYKAFKGLIHENHNETQNIISDKIWDSFITYQNEQLRRDDVELITFKPHIKDA